VEKKRSSVVVPIDLYVKRAECVSLALINNMPDAAIEDTELQFFELLDDASGDAFVFLKLYSLTEVPRTDRGQRHLNDFYFGLDDLWANRFDGVIVTGTEPRQPDLRQEPYWSALTDVLDWAERNTVSTVLSCLARTPVFFTAMAFSAIFFLTRSSVSLSRQQSLTMSSQRHATPLLRFPHSRWNELKENALTACGYEVLTKSDQAGVDVFVKQKKKSLFVHFQGHPEYQAETLFKEYRRDIKRFLRGERENYPTMPQGYFDQASAEILADFQRTALADRREEHLALFPETVAKSLQKTWQPSATCIYRNWLRYVLAKTARGIQVRARHRFVRRSRA